MLELPLRRIGSFFHNALSWAKQKKNGGIWKVGDERHPLHGQVEDHDAACAHCGKAMSSTDVEGNSVTYCDKACASRARHGAKKDATPDDDAD